MTTNYDDIISGFNTMDILLFNGQDFWFSYVVECLTGSKFSHIGLVLKSPTYIDPSLTGTYFLESGSEVIPDAQDGKIKFGVQITDLETVIKNYTGRIYYRKLQTANCTNNNNNNNPSPIGSQYDQSIADIYKTVYDKSYDDNVGDLLKADLGINIGDNQRMDDFFCSALVTYVYVKLGLLPDNIQWDLIQPKDYIPNGKIDTILKNMNNTNGDSNDDNNKNISVALGNLVKIK